MREWEHLGRGKYDESLSQLVSAYATLNNAPFQMVNLLNPRLPLAPHSQHARKALGREHKDSSQAAMTEERPQQSLLLSVSSTDAATCLCSGLKDALLHVLVIKAIIEEQHYFYQ